MAVLLCSAMLCLALTGCDSPGPDKEFISYRKVDDNTWSPDMPVTFDLFFPKIGDTYSLQLLLRHNNDYPSGRVSIRVEFMRDYQYRRVDTLHLNLASAPGKWLGHGVVLKEISCPVYYSISPPIAGIYKLNVSPLDVSGANGIENVGVRLLKK